MTIGYHLYCFLAFYYIVGKKKLSGLLGVYSYIFLTILLYFMVGDCLVGWVSETSSETGHIEQIKR